MANRPQVPGWTNINLNKTEEYSSEFSVNNFRFATVVNVNTGQRQIYFVSGLTGTFLTTRTLLATINADGTVTKGSGYKDFTDRFGNNELNSAINTSKTQACFITKRASTEDEKDDLSKTKEYRSCYAGRNTDPNDEDNSGSAKPSVPKIPSKFLVYPIDIVNTNQDRIKFIACEISGRTGGILGLPAYTPIQTEPLVYITIQGPISDQNGVSWGEDKINAAEAAMFNVADASIDPNISGSETFISEFKKTTSQLDAQKTQAGAAAMAAGNVNAFTRATQQVLNPNLELLFREPQLRPFSFTFLMSAREEKEAKEIKQIIRFFKKNMAPSGTPGSLFLKAPYVFWIDYLEGKNRDHKSINLIAPEKAKTKACALQDMKVDYTPMGSYMTFDDDEKTMVAYRLQLQFKEISPIYREDYDDIAAKDHPIGY